MVKNPLNQAQLSKAKVSNTTRRVKLSDAVIILNGSTVPQVGDIVLAEVK